MEGNRVSVERSSDRGPSLDQDSQGGRKELVLRWFKETQEAGLTQDGHFPDWFHGFTSRKDAEEQLGDKAVGVFLIRLSEKAIGYVLSYKGEERCRHFVISQTQQGHFSITGDNQEYASLAALIEHYKVSPIQPFGEYLTNDEEEAQEGTLELYDVVNVQTKVTTGVSVQALCSLWDQKGAAHRVTPPKAKSLELKACMEQVPALPSKSARKLSCSMSVDTMKLPQRITDKPTSLGSLPAIPSVDPSLSPNSRTLTKFALTREELPLTSPRMSPLPVTYSSVVHPESRSKSLPCLDQDNEPSAPVLESPPPATHSRQVICSTYSLLEPQERLKENVLKSNPIYQAVKEKHMARPYREIREREQKQDSTYEEIDLPDRGRDNKSNPYESVEELRSKRSKCTWGKNKDWKNLIPDFLKK